MDKTRKFIENKIRDEGSVVLVIVADVSGSSPGRKGFKMAVSAMGETSGSVGGGLMEHNITKLAGEMISKGDTQAKLIRYLHSANAGKEASGLICAGEQTHILLPLKASELDLIQSIRIKSDNIEEVTIEVGQDGINITGKAEEGSLHGLIVANKNWLYRETIFPPVHFYIFGGGHISIPLSELGRMLGYRVVVLDERRGLHTMRSNKYAHLKKIIEYRLARKYIKSPENSLVAIMTNSHEKDEVVLNCMLGLPLKYLGMVGSKNKLKKILSNLENKGRSRAEFKHLNSPAGLDIGADTAAEIAVSIAAQIIRFEKQLISKNS